MMNQLVVFDPRFPHGVTELKGTRDPMKGRLVLHGWFVNPRPYVTGGLSTAQVQKALTPVFNGLNDVLSQIDLLDGTMSLRLAVTASGSIQQYKILTNTLVSISNKPEDIQYFNKEIKSLITKTRFVKAKRASLITLPLIFK
jgi:hypothetical protein